MKKIFLLSSFVMFLFMTQGISQSNVTFSVDMNGYTGGAFTTVYVSGSFNGWSGDANAMADPDMDGIWTTTLPLADGAIEYKFTLDNWAVEETFAGGESCTLTTGAFTNRFYIVSGDASIPVAGWEACPPAADGNVTFDVDMNNYTGGAFTTVYLSGTFNGWSGTSNPMADPEGDGVWTITLPLTAGPIEYKFTLDDWVVQENFLGGEPCTVTNGGFTNRSLNVNGDATVGTVCWESCDACSVPPSNVTFSVDMNDYTGGAFTTVHMSGNFNGWSGNANPMADPEGDGVWTVTLPLTAGNIEYKFTLDDWAAEETFVGGESCTVTNGGFTNRFYAVAGDATLDAVCWNSCEACATPCGPPTNVGHSLGSPASCTITWDEHPNALRYDVIYRVQGTTIWTRTGALSNSKTLHYLAPNTWYQYRVRSYCGTWDFANNATGFRYFNTGNTPLVREGFTEFSTDIIDMYPNPASEVLNLEISTETRSDVNISIVDMMGKTVMDQTIGDVEGFQRETIDVAGLGAGYYMVVMTAGDQRVVKKFAKVK